MTKDELQDNISCIKHIAKDKLNSDSIKNPSRAFWVAGLAIEVIEELQKRIKRAKLETSKKQDARIDLAYCNGFDAGYNAANEPKYPESLVNSIELRRLKALQVLKPESKLPNYKKLCIDLKIVEESKNE